jgi:hypothetical protein
MWHRDENGKLWYVTIPLSPDSLLDQPMLLVTPPAATVNVGGNQQYKATYYPGGVLEGNGQDVTNSSTWTVADATIASIGANTGLATGKVPGATQVIATYTVNGKTLQGKARLVVENQINLVALRIDPGVYGEADPGAAYTAAVDFQNKSDLYLKGVPVGGFNMEYRAVLKDGSGNEVQYADFSPGEIKTFYFTYHAPDSGETRISGVIDTDPLEKKYQETTYSDNKVFAAIKVRDADLSGQGDRRLQFQAYSRPGEDIYGVWQPSRPREPNTAKYTDEVHATLTVDRPKPPKGSLDWWEITWARLTHPEQNPEFCFGNPVEPISGDNVTKNMDVPGRGLEEQKKATLVFEEDWSMAGFNYGSEAPGVWNDMTGELMAAEPKIYPVSVRFKVTYQYTYTVCTCDEDGCFCWPVTETRTYEDVATRNLRVEGTGTYLFAN